MDHALKISQVIERLEDLYKRKYFILQRCKIDVWAIDAITDLDDVDELIADCKEYLTEQGINIPVPRSRYE